MNIKPKNKEWITTIDEFILSLDQNTTHKKILGIKTDLFTEQISICFPEHFYELSAEKIKERYATEPRPHTVYSNEDGNINFGFHLLQEKNINLPIYLSRLKDAIRMVYPNILVYEEKSIELEQKNCELYYFDFRTSSLEGPIYNILYLASNKEKVLMGAFNCPFEKYSDWKQTAMEVMQTIVINE